MEKLSYDAIARTNSRANPRAKAERPKLSQIWQFPTASAFLLAIILAGLLPASAQEPRAPQPDSAAVLAQLLERLQAEDARLKDLEAEVARLKLAREAQGSAEAANTAAIAASVPPPPSSEAHEHSLQMPGGGPVLKIRAFADFNLGLGSNANSLIFPLVAPGQKIHNTFQLGEFDLFLSSRLSKRVSAVSENIIGTDASNSWGLDIERLQITFKANPYFTISGGRYHTSIGYYNTAFHHGTWFQTATGRPFMFFFEDSGGVIPVHQIGVTATGLVPRTGKMELHWVAEVGNGRSSDPLASPAQNFLSDKNHKSVNFAAFIKPQFVPGLQIGGSYYHDRLIPPAIPHVNENLTSAYVVYNNSTWEIMNEAVWMNHKMDGATRSYNSPLAYAQVSRKFGSYRPYFRFQYVNIPANDPISIFKGRYDGPSVGLRMDFTEYAALKTQYNRLYQRGLPAANGVDFQVAFTY